MLKKRNMRGMSESDLIIEDQKAARIRLLSTLHVHMEIVVRVVD